MRALRIFALAIAGALVTCLILAGAGWALFGRPDDGRVAPRVTLAGQAVGGLDEGRVSDVVRSLADSYRDTEITIGSGAQTFVTRTSVINLEVDVAGTTAAVMSEGRTGAAPVRIAEWVASLFGTRKAAVEIIYDAADYRRVLDASDPGPRTPPVEPDVRFVEGELVAVEGSNGEGLTTKGTAEALTAAATRGLPLRAVVERGDVEPRFSAQEVQALIDRANALGPMTIEGGGATASASPAALKSWLRTVVSDDRLVFGVDEAAIGRDLPGLLPGATTAPIDPHYDVIGTRPRLDEGTPGATCCDPAAAGVVGADLIRRLSGPAVDTPVVVPMRPVPPNPNPRATPALGVVERVASFTTRHPAGQPRVRNIQRMADLVRGHVILPGEMFSLNTHVGPRTIEKGFVEDAIILDARFERAVGGGVSQFATTLFNAAFFAGLDYGEYMAHTIYISRYPYGREATISHPHPDLQIRNTTPFGILIWPTYTSSSITVDLYSTHFVDAEQTGQTTAPLGPCTRVTTERTRRYVDGRVEVDSVRAVYQPEEGVRCF